MLNFLGGYKYVVDFMVIALLVAGIGYGVHTYNSWQQGIGEERIQVRWDRQRLVDSEALNQLKTQYQKEKDDAATQSTKNIAIAAAAASAANQSGRVLNDTIKSLIIASASGNIEANRKYTAALGAVLGECQAAYRGMADKAQGHANDALMFDQAWPH